MSETETMDERVAGPENDAQRPPGQLEYREATQLAVNFQKRIIELVVMPYDERSLVEHHGRMITESVAPGAFDGIQGRPGRVKANRDHDNRRPVGKAVAFHPSREEGLVGEIYISNTELGDETLTLADDGVLDASAAFLPMPGGEQWPSRDERRLSKVWLGHVALTPDPAFEGAKVLSVRSQGMASSSTPNADEVRAWLLADEYGKLSPSR